MDHRVNQVEANEGVEHPKVVVGIPLSGGYQSGPYSRPGQRTAPQQVGSHRIQGPPEYQQQNQDQNQDQDKQDQQKEQDKQQDQQKDQQQNQDQQQQPSQPEKKDNEMSKENAEQLLNSVMQDEKDVQDKVKKQQVLQGGRLEKDW